MRPATSSALLGLAVLLAGRGTLGQTDLVEVCETHPTWHSDRCLDANGEVLPDVDDYLTCERTTTGYVWTDNPSPAVEQVKEVAPVCRAATTCTETAAVSVPEDAAACAAVSYTGHRGRDDIHVTSVDQRSCEDIKTSDPDDGDAKACTYTPKRPDEECADVSNCHGAGCQLTPGVEPIDYVAEVFPCTKPHSVADEENYPWFNEEIEAATHDECVYMHTGRTWEPNDCPWVADGKPNRNSHIQTGTGVDEACYPIYPRDISAEQEANLDAVMDCVLTPFTAADESGQGGNDGSCAVSSTAPEV